MTQNSQEKIYLRAEGHHRFSFEYFEVIGLATQRAHSSFYKPHQSAGFMVKSKTGEILFFPTDSEKYTLLSESKLQILAEENDTAAALKKLNSAAVEKYFNDRLREYNQRDWSMA